MKHYTAVMNEYINKTNAFVELNIDLLEFVLIAIHDSNSQHQFLRIVIIEDAVQVITKT